MYEDTDRPQPPVEDGRGSLGSGFLWFWLLLFPIWIFVGGIASTGPLLVLLLGAVAPLLFAVVLALCGKPRTGMGVALGYASVFPVALLLFTLWAL